MARERLQKILAHAGLASRRAAEALIAAGKVRVNGVVVSEVGASADARKDKIEVDGKRVVLEKPVYYVLHKPRGMVSTLSDPEGRPHLGEMLRKIGERVYPVGRLDFHTSGVMLVTNDGELTDALLHPRKDVPKTYVAKLRGFVSVDDLDKLRNGVVLDDGHKTKSAEVFVLREEERNTWVQITLHEGKNRQIHRMGEAIGHTVLRLARVSFAGITAEGLRPGDWRELDARELEKLKKAYITPARRAKDQAADTSRAEPRGPGAGRKPRPTTERSAKPPRRDDDAPRSAKPRPYEGAPRSAKSRPYEGAPRSAKPTHDDDAPRSAKTRPYEGAPRGPKQGGYEGAPRGAKQGRDEAPRGPKRGRDEAPRGTNQRAYEGALRGAKPARHDDARPAQRRAYEGAPRGPSPRPHDGAPRSAKQRGDEGASRSAKRRPYEGSRRDDAAAPRTTSPRRDDGPRTPKPRAHGGAPRDAKARRHEDDDRPRRGDDATRGPKARPSDGAPRSPQKGTSKPRADRAPSPRGDAPGSRGSRPSGSRRS